MQQMSDKPTYNIALPLAFGLTLVTLATLYRCYIISIPRSSWVTEIVLSIAACLFVFFVSMLAISHLRKSGRNSISLSSVLAVFFFAATIITFVGMTGNALPSLIGGVGAYQVPREGAPMASGKELES